MKNKRIKIMVIAIGVLILLMGIIYRNTYIVKNDRIVIKEMSESTQVSDLNSLIDRLNTEHDEYKRYIENSKAQIADAITYAGVNTEETDSFETMITNVSKILSTKTNDATARADSILSGKTAYVKGSKVTGTMKDNGAVTKKINIGESYTIPKGYHNGSGKITVNSISDSIMYQDVSGSCDNISDINIYGIDRAIPINKPSVEGYMLIRLCNTRVSSSKY